MTTDLRTLPAEVVGRLRDGYGDELVDGRHAGLWIDYRGRTLEHRAVPRIELRSDDEGNPVLDGYATVYEHAYDVAGGAPFGWSEIIARGAADKSVAEQDDVFLFFDHEGLPMARTRSGSLVLESDVMGLRSEAHIDRSSPYSMEIVSRVARGELDAMSFAFTATRQEWNDDYTERRILELRLFDVSVVSFPANPATVVQARHDKPAADPGRSLALARAQAERLRLASA